MRVRWWSARDRGAVIVAVVVPIAVCAIVAPFRANLPNTDAALVLVVAIVAVAAYGHRVAGLCAAASAGASFDFFLTAPYDRMSIGDGNDVKTFVLILMVGAVVTELAVRGRRSRLRALTDEEYLDVIETTSAVVESRVAQSELTSHICTQLTRLLGLRSCRFEPNRFGGLPRLESDGRLRDLRCYVDVEQHGLPSQEVEMLASVRGHVLGRFVLRPTGGVAPTLAARKCAVIVVAQAAAALASYRRAA